MHKNGSKKNGGAAPAAAASPRQVKMELFSEAKAHWIAQHNQISCQVCIHVSRRCFWELASWVFDGILCLIYQLLSVPYFSTSIALASTRTKWLLRTSLLVPTKKSLGLELSVAVASTGEPLATGYDVLVAIIVLTIHMMDHTGV